MLVLMQRVSKASVSIAGETVASISRGLLLLCGLEKHDNLETTLSLIDKCTRYRVFSDSDEKMNLSIRDIAGEMLIVPQFTLAADTQKGLRPGFSRAMSQEDAKVLFGELQVALNTTYPHIQFGVFQADMDVSLTNQGPVTFLLSN